MRFSESWLREWINPEVDTAELAHRLTLAGLEVDAIDAVAGEFTGIVVGEVLAVEPHPEADRLRVTRVNDGEGEHVVVCGAPNVATGMRVPFARIGAVLPGGMKIKKAKLRGMESFGMLCSATELGIESDIDGLWPLPADAPVGADVRDWLGLDDHAIELGITPNRGDALSILGLARECSALFDQDIREPMIIAPQAGHDERKAASIADSAACPQYLTQVIRDLPARGETPLWISERLRRAGIKSIEPIVDITNYVMLELGQPLHAFDHDRIDGDITVRLANASETMTALGEQELKLDDDFLVIADQRGPIALAGVIGGQHSAVDGDTRHIVLEAAHFTPTVIAGRARRLGLSTDAAFRFERGVDPALPERALARAAQLITQVVGGTAGPVTVAEGGSERAPLQRIILDLDWAERRLGMPVASDHAATLLRRLGCAVAVDGNVLTVDAPSHRFDLAIPEDLLEELARLIGFDAFRAPIGRTPITIAARSETRTGKARMADVLTDLGYYEAINYSFIDPEWSKAVAPDHEPIALANPLSNELSVMRTSLWPGLIRATQFNQNRQQDRVRLFEIGHVFTGTLEDRRETDRLAGIVSGSHWPEQWGEKERKVDFFDLKGDVEALLEAIGFDLAASGDSKPGIRFAAAEHPALHPGQSARISRVDDGEETAIGWIGALHPELAKRFDLKGAAFVFELDIDAIDERSLPAYQPLSKFPLIRRDLALVKPADQPLDAVLAIARENQPEALREIALFDRYVGPGVAEGFESIALKLTFQDFSRTLTDEEISAIISDILDRLAKQGIQLRS